ncbi:hypothetical protein NQ317_012146 [Molorchus minor]|uniref:DUF5641 domain-containing protein n=1 Tax=Molorchus minor TaxID=1323400 RepID=A0ABQ9JZZ2_9CUCU|nr:hypothetical protein NQ317_012146 [Molorchus minor]
MYRQILVAPPHQDYQRILWRFSPDEDVQSYRLKTVTYGVSSSPFLAIRTLLQLAHEGQDKFPLASEAISKFTYVDDVICSCKSLSEANRLRSELVVLLESGGFHLRKWASNNSIFLSSIPPEECQQNSLSFDSQDYSIKILGLIWDPSNDHFKYNIAPLDRPCTKRTILSELARIFDPLGFITPLTFFAKHLIQHLWTLGLQWDEVPPAEVLQVWLQYKKELKLLSDISVPRHQLHQSFWSRWHNEYLQTLQQRNKWDKNAPPIEPGMLVLIKNEQEPPLHWRLGRVLHTHPGRDGIIRVVTLNTARGQLPEASGKIMSFAYLLK